MRKTSHIEKTTNVLYLFPLQSFLHIFFNLPLFMESANGHCVYLPPLATFFRHLLLLFTYIRMREQFLFCWFCCSNIPEIKQSKVVRLYYKDQDVNRCVINLPDVAQSATAFFTTLTRGSFSFIINPFINFGFAKGYLQCLYFFGKMAYWKDCLTILFTRPGENHQ